MKTEILVVGAGPVGLTLALALRRQGVAVRIVDKSAARTDKSKAVVIWPRTLELLDIQGCAQAFVDAGVPALYIAADEPSPRCDMVRLRELLPQLQLGQTVGSGHFCQLEVPEQVQPMIERFLAIAELT